MGDLTHIATTHNTSNKHLLKKQELIFIRRICSFTEGYFHFDGSFVQ